MRTFISIILISLSMVLYSQDIAVIGAGGGNHYWEQVYQGAKKASLELGYSLYTRRPSDELNYHAQSTLIEQLVNNGIKAVVVAPMSQEQNQLFLDLSKREIPIIYIDRDFGGYKDSLIMTNNKKVGELAAIEMAKELNGSGNVLLCRMDPSVISTTQRENGFYSKALELGLNIVDDPVVGTTIGDIRISVSKLLRGNIEIDGIYTPNEYTTVGTLASLREINNKKKVVHIGTDTSTLISSAIKIGDLKGTVVQNPFEMGYLSIYQIDKCLKKDKNEKFIETHIDFITSEDL